MNVYTLGWWKWHHFLSPFSLTPSTSSNKSNFPHFPYSHSSRTQCPPWYTPTNPLPNLGSAQHHRLHDVPPHRHYPPTGKNIHIQHLYHIFYPLPSHWTCHHLPHRFRMAQTLLTKPIDEYAHRYHWYSRRKHMHRVFYQDWLRRKLQGLFPENEFDVDGG